MNRYIPKEFERMINELSKHYKPPKVELTPQYIKALDEELKRLHAEKPILYQTKKRNQQAMKDQDFKKHLSAELRYCKAELAEMLIRVEKKKKHIQQLTERLKTAK